MTKGAILVDYARVSLDLADCLAGYGMCVTSGVAMPMARQETSS
jgi:hypothetical protein